jgi:amino acid adenylation domain-containing protein
MSEFIERVSHLSENQRKLLALRLERADIENSYISKIRKHEDDRLPIPLSFAQQQMWILDQFSPGTTVYTIPAGLRFVGKLHLQAIRHALEEIVLRHEVLRTIFVTMNEHLAQVVQPSYTLPIIPQDLSFLDQEEQEEALQRLIQEELARPFDLAQGPLFRAQLVRLAPEEHFLVLNVHHIVFDGWSSGLLTQEFIQLYEAYALGNPSPLPPLSLQYADFAHWQREWAQGPQMQEQLAFWRQHLSGPLPVLELPLDRPRPPMQTFAGARCPVRVSAELTSQLAALGQTEGATLFMTVLAAFETLLFRYSGQDDLLIGTPTANRNQAETEQLIGCFINTLVLRTDLSGEPTFRDVLRRVRQVCLEAYSHQDVPFEEIVEMVHPEREGSHSPLFQVMFAFQNAPHPPLQLTDLTMKMLDISSSMAKFDLTLVVWETAEGLQGQFEYNTALFEVATIERMATHLHTLLESMSSHLDQRLSALPLLSEAESRQILLEWNDTQVEYLHKMYVHQLVEAQVARTSDAVALVCGEEQLTYGDLNRRANQVAHFLRRVGVGPEVLVGICVERSVEMVVGLLGILKAGGGYVPLDPQLPLARTAFILQDAGAQIVLTQQHLMPQFSTGEYMLICLDMCDNTVGQEQTENPINVSTDEQVAYIIYTSGSTGLSKGVTLTHGNIRHLLNWGLKQIDWLPSDHVVQYLSYFFDWSVWEIFRALICGASLYMIPLETLLDPVASATFLANNYITVWHATPTQFRFVTGTGRKLDTLRWVCLGAERFDRDLLNQCSNYLPTECQVFNAYGPTEATVTTTILEITLASALQAYEASVPIGRPIANWQCYILDANYAVLPVGIPGELYIAGEGLARGYIGKVELTAQAFVPNPFVPGARMYRTGDRVKWLADGTIEFLGRLDHQIKLRGFRIELEEIEVALSQHPAVSEAIVQLHEDAGGEKRLIAYIVTKQHPFAGTELRKYLKRTLPSYMLPAAFVLLEAFPLSANGKIDRQALLPPEVLETEHTEEFVAPRTPVEEKLIAIWLEILKCGRISVSDNFFLSGGHSLLATQVISRINDTFHIQLPLRSLFEEPTPSGLAEIIEQMQKDNHSGLWEQPIVPLAREAYRGRLSSFNRNE